MKTLKLIGLVPLAMFAAVSFAQDDNRAVPRGSSGGGSSASDAGSRHSGGSSGSSSTQSSGSSSASGGSQYNNGGSQSSRSSDAARRRPRPGTGSGDRGRYENDGGYRSYRSYPYSNYFYDPYYYSWGYPGSRYGLYGYGYGYYDYGYSYGDYYGYYPSQRSYRYRSGNIAQVRTLVEPSKARVYVDGYYAGIVDDFDGLLQRLNVSPGRHEITLRHEGYRSHTFSIYANRDQTLKLRYDMVRGSGESRDSVGEEERRLDRDADRRDGDSDRDDPRVDMDRDRDRDSARETDRSREVDAERPYVPPARETGRGEVVLEIEPGDASVYVDGEFYGKAAQLTRLELPTGRHRIEVVRPGYKTEETEVNVLGEATRVVVKLSRR